MPLDCLSAGILVADHLCSPIERLPEAGQLVLADALPLAIGGCAANTAMDLARVGARVGVVGCVGRDPFGGFICATLDRQGIDTRGIRQLDDAATSGTLIINVRGQDRRFIHSVGANAAFRAEMLSADEIAQARVFYVGGYLLMCGLDPAALARLFAEVRCRGVKTVLDVVLPGPADYWPRLEPVLAETDVFHANIDEARALTGLADPLAQAERFHAAGARAAVVTCGEAGTVLVSDRARLRAGAYPVEFVGGTGAGDAFDAGYIVGLMEGEDEAGCLRWGSALGASCVRAIGATEGVFTRAEAEAFMREHELKIDRL